LVVAGLLRAGLVLLAAGAVTSAVPAADAEVVAGQPDESIQQAYPISAGHTYTGAFDTTNYDDVDYLAFQVTQANQTLEFTVANTTQNCADPNGAGCPVYATLMDSNDQQVGGDASAAGTIATNGDTEVFDWTFAAPGTYYVLMESNGDEAPGNPSYSIVFGAPANGGTGGTGGTSTSPLVRSLIVRPHQRGAAVSGRAVLGQPGARLFATLFAPGQRPRFVARLMQQNLAVGSHRFSLPLSAGYRARLKRRHHLSLLLKLTVATSAGQHLAVSRRVTLTG
jgi:hypothetical protein